MKILFVFDTRFRRVGEQIYSTGALNEEILGRYAALCDELIVVARVVDEKNAIDKWSPISNPKISVYGDASLRYKNLENFIKTCDAMIVRLPSFLGGQAIDINKKYGKPYLVEMVACPWDSLWNHSFAGKVLAPFGYLKTKRLVRSAPYACYVSKHFLQSRYPSKGETLGCCDAEIPELTKNMWLERHSEADGDKPALKIGTVGSYDVLYKGQEYIIKAMGILKNMGMGCFEYYLVGDGDSSRLKKIAEKSGVAAQVHFVGSMPHNQIFEWLDTIDVYAQPSKAEALGRAIVEAMSRGLPVIGSSVGGIPEMVPEPYLFKKGDVKSIVKVLRKLSADELVQMSKRNFAEAHDYQKDILDEKRNAFYEKFVKEAVK